MDANKSHIDQSTIYFTQTLNTSSYVGMGCCVFLVDIYLWIRYRYIITVALALEIKRGVHSNIIFIE